MRVLIFCFLLVGISVNALAAEALSGDTIRLDDGRIVRLLGIKAEGQGARQRLQTFLAQNELIFENGAMDRYGRIAADAYVEPVGGEKLWLQGAMLQEGLAFVYPPTGTEPHFADLLKLEGKARQVKKGIWNNPVFDDAATDYPKKIGYGHFAFVSGKAVKAERVKNMVYLNFGTNWRYDFTAAIAAHDLRHFRKSGVDPLAYEGKNIRVRGWVKRDFGPMIAVTNPAQIEVLGEPLAKP